jgi:hypothetical protein
MNAFMSLIHQRPATAEARVHRVLLLRANTFTVRSAIPTGYAKNDRGNDDGEKLHVRWHLD